MNQQDIDRQAALSLIDRAVASDSLTIADILIESAHRLDNSVPIEEYRKVVRNNWQTREYNKRMELYNGK